MRVVLWQAKSLAAKGTYWTFGEKPRS